MIVTRWPASLYRANTPPHPDSGSSGCAPTQTTFSLLAGAADCAASNARGDERISRRLRLAWGITSEDIGFQGTDDENDCLSYSTLNCANILECRSQFCCCLR